MGRGTVELGEARTEERREGDKGGKTHIACAWAGIARRAAGLGAGVAVAAAVQAKAAASKGLRSGGRRWWAHLSARLSTRGPLFLPPVLLCGYVAHLECGPFGLCGEVGRLLRRTRALEDAFDGVLVVLAGG